MSSDKDVEDDLRQLLKDVPAYSWDFCWNQMEKCKIILVTDPFEFLKEHLRKLYFCNLWTSAIDWLWGSVAVLERYARGTVYAGFPSSWATPWENVSSGVSDQARHKPAFSVTETSYSLEISAIESREIILSKQRTTKALIRLRGSAPLLFAYDMSELYVLCITLVLCEPMIRLRPSRRSRYDSEQIRGWV